MTSVAAFQAPRYRSDDRLITMSAAHDAFRRDLNRLVVVATPANLAEKTRFDSIQNGWRVFTNQLHIHHRHEDSFLWPRLRKRTAGSRDNQALLDQMEHEHSRIDPLLAAVDTAFARPLRGEVGRAVEDLFTNLDDHLRHEEKLVMPLINDVITDEEWALVVKDIRRTTKLSSAAEFMPWLTEGTTADETKAILSIMPPPARLVFKKVWRPRYDKVSHW